MNSTELKQLLDSLDSKVGKLSAGELSVFNSIRDQYVKVYNLIEYLYKGIKDRAGNPYVNHLERVSRNGDTMDEQIVGLLHDVIEDRLLDYPDLVKLGCTRDQVIAIFALTRDPAEKYSDYIERVSKCRLARQVKLNDLSDNMRLQRYGNLTKHDVSLYKRYEKAYKFLIEKVYGIVI